MPSLLLGGAGPSSGVAFSPATVSGLNTWYDFSALGLADGTAVSSVSDLSGNGHTASQATGSKQPTFKTAIQNGLGVIRFDGSSVNDMCLDAAGVVLTQPDTIFIVAQVSDTSASRTLLDGINATGRNIIRLGSGTQWEIYAGTSVLGGAEDTSWHLFTAVFNGASSSLRIDRSGVISGAAGAQGTTSGIKIGIAQDGSTNNMAGDIGEMLFYSGALGATDRDNVETYLRNKWGTP